MTLTKPLKKTLAKKPITKTIRKADPFAVVPPPPSSSLFRAVPRIVPVKGVTSGIEGVAYMMPEKAEVRIHPDLQVPETYVGIDKDTKRIRNLTTRMPDGLMVAWDTCGSCREFFTICKCRDGVGVGRSIEWIYDLTRARLAGEEWDIRHRDYYGSIRPAWQKSRQRSSKGLAPLRLVGDTQPARKSVSGAPVRPTAPLKRLSKPGAGDAVIATGDMSALDQSAAASVKTLTKSFAKMAKTSSKKTLSKPTGKVLKKK